VHAGIPDTSELLHLKTPGQWVRKDKFAAANAATGVNGNPALASAELGKLYLNMKVQNAVKQIRAFAAGGN
jgi:creatinine amidohydrolase/Fe(II)-dependent formamide hydrolase-like protein